ncbi:hypothetical protein ACJRO7_035554 [Eucalyptus globulus]|uniref:Uncharacterized protein n=1 Tax=Eucalyptus globulus TaxID=34317 RepID=A0ABD3J960_EUCGL
MSSLREREREREFMEVDICFFLAWCLLAITALSPTGCCGARAPVETGNATIPRWCHSGECLIAYQQPEVELMAVLDLEHALGNSMPFLKPGDVSRGSGKREQSANCSRIGKGRITPCVPEQNSDPHYSPYQRDKG